MKDKIVSHCCKFGHKFCVTSMMWTVHVWFPLALFLDYGLCQTRINLGFISEPNSRPFQVALYSRVGAAGELGFCSGSLITPQWVLTAAHCCFHDGAAVDHIQAILGAHSLYDRYENGRRVVNVADIVVHPEYQPETFSNDVALLQLVNVVQLTETVDTVRLPYRDTSTFNFAGMASVVSGWGIAAEGVPFVAPSLRERTMTIITDTLCNNHFFNELPENVVCALSGTAGTCKGDNGGPLTIFYNLTQEVILIGVASFVDASGCNTDLPSVFTRVQRHLDWIADTTGIPID